MPVALFENIWLRNKPLLYLVLYIFLSLNKVLIHLSTRVL